MLAQLIEKGSCWVCQKGQDFIPDFPGWDSIGFELGYFFNDVVLENFPVEFGLQFCEFLDELIKGDWGILNLEVVKLMLGECEGEEEADKGGSHGG